MQYHCPLIAVTDLERSKRFYREILDCDVIEDFGANVTLTGGFALQTLETWSEFLEKTPAEIVFGHCAGELYFEETDMDAFLARLDASDEVDYVCPPLEHRWGQRVVRFYDPDRHIIEVGEAMTQVVRRFIAKGLSVEQTAARMDVPVAYVREQLSDLSEYDDTE